MYRFFFFFASRRRHTRFSRDWSSDVCSSDLQRNSFRGRQAAKGVVAPAGAKGRLWLSMCQIASVWRRAISIAAILLPRFCRGERASVRRSVGKYGWRPAVWAASTPAAVALAGLLDLGAETAVADQLARCREAGDVADLGGDREAEDPGDTRASGQQRDVAVVGAERAQLLLAGCDLLVEGVDQRERRTHS